MTCAEEKKCNRMLSFNSGIDTVYYKCDKKPFIMVEYKSAQNSEMVMECLCKIHYNALVKNIVRIESKTRFKFNLTTKII